MDDRLVEMTVDSVRLHAPTKQHVVVLRERRGERYLPVWSNAVEANSISLTLGDRTFERPLTHDLLMSILEAAAVSVTRVVLVSPGPAAYASWVEATSGRRRLQIDARPADAIAIALRAGAPIWVEEPVLEQDGVLRPDGSSPGDDRLATLRDIVNAMDLPALGEAEPEVDL